MGLSLVRPLPLSFIAFAFGAAAAALLLGVPRLWTAEAAGWASAVATTAAVLVALYVGLAPQKAQRADHVRRARAIGTVVNARFLRMESNLSVVHRLSTTGPVDREIWALIIPLLKVDPRCADELLPYFDGMSDEVASAVAAAMADIEWAQPNLEPYGIPGLAALEAERLGEDLDPLIRSLQRARRNLEPFVTGSPALDIEPDIQRRVGTLRMLMVSRREAQGGLNKDH
ncbi:hypothetical protein [Xanthomonas sp. fls2-241-TYG-148]|uniref:hypothetical protein n=1 Tax=Xanthomonas sp. fls2-241-TYG-148 TaxID=3040328 RepID=UPI002555728B|nr:hypothetical protein [Xanthomonas sp. fls2-241-TYG-148]